MEAAMRLRLGWIFFSGFVMACALAVPRQGWNAAAEAQTRVPESQAEITLSFAPVVKRAAPAVVNIYTRKVVAQRMSPFRGDPFFEQFFGEVFRDLPARRRIQNSLGSGVIVDAAGIAVSNHHVVAGADEITVVLADRREFAGRVIFADKASDLAVVRLDGLEDARLPVLELRDSDSLEVGDLVLAIGNPFGVGQTVTSGIVSGLSRAGPKRRGEGYFIQTDAAINPGNSGGALVDMAGRLVGVPTSIVSRSGGSNGIGFAVPANLVARVIAEAKDGNDSLTRPWLGMKSQSVSGDLADALGLDLPRGVLIDQLHPLSPLAMAGLTPGDVVTEIDGVAIDSPAELAFRAATIGIGTEADLAYLRDGAVGEATVRLAPAPEVPPSQRTTFRRGALAGLTAETVNPKVIEARGLPISASGALVLQVQGPARRTGLRRGDLILEADGKAVDSVDELHDVQPRFGQPSKLLVERNGRRGSIVLGG